MSEQMKRPVIDRISIVLRPADGQTLEQITPFVQLGAHVSIGRGLAVIAGASDEDLQLVLGQERDERQMQAELQQAALGAPAHLAAHAKEMFDLLNRINVKCGGLDAVLSHGGEPSEQMWDESREAMDAIWDLLDKVQSAASVDTDHANRIARGGENVSPEAEFSIDDHIRMAADARRYRWLRDVAFDTPRQDLVPRDSHQNMLIEEDLDGEIDRAMKAYSSEREIEACEQ
ncbi:hypothetical protein [Pseudomonas fluorescens]|uniref:Uncharacterized protein n=1 Tax=Pseudomonas fluorescens TaxID=294 RepID=A0A5E7EDP5_PSEFL|nr:hypothetical protein [Pseudomonas fluorescens]VVO24457.1 hypothetical protein PS710_04509 [Pseudomonas fluorescens]